MSLPVFMEVQFPVGIDSLSMKPKGGAAYNTSVITGAAGDESRNQWWEIPRRSWDIAIFVKDEETFNIVESFHRVAGGKARGFRKRDWTFFLLENEVVIGAANGVRTIFQLAKNYTVGPYSTAIPIKKPVTSSVVDWENNPLDDTVHVYFDDVEQVSGWTVDHTTGIITFVSAPPGGTVITADCEFDIASRFDTDKIEWQIDENRLPGSREDGYYTAASIPILEVKV